MQFQLLDSCKLFLVHLYIVASKQMTPRRQMFSLFYRFPVTQLGCGILVCQCLYIDPSSPIITIMQVYHLISCFLKAVDPVQKVSSTDFADCIAALDSAINKYPNRARNRFHELVNILSAMLLDPTFTLSNYAKFYDVLMDAFCSCSLTVKHNSDSIGQMLRAAVAILSKVQVQVTMEWSNPSNNDCEEDVAELSMSSELMSSVERLCVQIGNQLVRATFVPIFREYLQLSQDWRQKYGALLVASKMGDEVEHIEEVKIFADCAIKQLQSVYPKVRLAAVELLGDLSYENTPIFQDEYFQTVVPMLIKLLGDQIPRVVSHTFASISNFISNLNEYWRIENISGQLLNSILHYFKNGTPFMKEAALDMVSALAKVRSSLGHNIVFLIQGCGEVLHSCQGQSQNQLLEATLQALSEIFQFQDKKIVGNYVPQYVESLFAYKSRIQASTFFACWNRLCVEYQAFADLQTTNIIPFLLSETSKEIENGLEEAADLQLDYLCNTFKAFTWRMRPYLQTIFEFGKKIMQNNETQFRIRNKSMEMMVSLLLHLRTEQVKQEDIFVDMGISILQYLIEFGDKCISEDGEILLLEGVLEGINRLIQALATALNQASIMGISDKLLAYQQKLEECLQKKEEEEDSQGKQEGTEIVELNQQIIEANEENSDQEEVYIAEQDNALEETQAQLLQILDLIPPVYSILLKASREGEKDMLINVLIPQISFAINKTFEWKMFGLNLALCLVQTCSYHQLSAYWGNLMMLFNGFVEDGNSKLRSLSAYGMGIIFEKTPQELIVEENVLTWMQEIWKGHQAPFDQDDDKAFVNFCKDNFVAALGKLIKSCGQKFPHLFSPEIYRKWLQALPLKHDDQETDSQQQLLIDILTSSPSLLVSDINDLTAVCQVFASFMILRCQARQSKILMRSKQCITSISSWDIFKRNCNQLLSNLKPNHRTALGKLLEL